LTPMISILNSVVERNPTQRISFIHGARTTFAQAFGKHIVSIARGRDNVTTDIFSKAPSPETDVRGRDYTSAGRVKLDALDKDRDLCLNDGNTLYFVCGPESFMADMDAGLREMGVQEARIKMEVFGAGVSSNSSETSRTSSVL